VVDEDSDDCPAELRDLVDAEFSLLGCRIFRAERAVDGEREALSSDRSQLEDPSIDMRDCFERGFSVVLDDAFEDPMNVEVSVSNPEMIWTKVSFWMGNSLRSLSDFPDADC
jgi:hypothetical protein